MGPGSRSLCSLGRGRDLLFVTADWPTTGHLPRATSPLYLHLYVLRTTYYVLRTDYWVHAVRVAVISLPLTGLLQPTDYKLQATSIIVLICFNY